MNFNFKDRVVVVTGGSKGIGLPIAEQLAARDALVVTGSRTISEELARARDERGITVVQTDLAAPEGRVS